MSIEESLLKSNFVGRDGFRWWIGQVAPEEAQGDQINGSGWGNRYKVRIMGYHPPDIIELPDNDLPWAQVLIGTTDGSGGASRRRTIRISPGDTVYGFFLDGDNAQVPVIQGLLGRTLAVTSNQYAGPFRPYTGYTSKIQNDGSYTGSSESSESNSAALPMPFHVSQELASSISDTARTAFDGIGQTIVAASTSVSSTIEKISVAVENFVGKVQNITGGMDVAGLTGSLNQRLNGAISSVTSHIGDLSTGLVGSMVYDAYDKVSSLANSGLRQLYTRVRTLVFAATKSSRIAHMAGVAAQRSFENPLESMQSAMPCITNNIIGGMGDAIKGLIKGIAGNVRKFKSCIGNQFLGGLMNKIIGGISNGLSGLLGGISRIMPGGFNIANMLREKAEGLLGQVMGASNCDRAPSSPLADVAQFVVGKGPKGVTPILPSAILEAANTAQAAVDNITGAVGGVASAAGDVLSIADGALGAFDFLNPASSSPGFTGGLGDGAGGSCNGAPEQTCNPPEVKIFGSNGSGGEARAVLGSTVGDGRERTASVIGVDVTNPGQKYNVPPFVEIVDNCNKGYGAVARAVIDYDEDSPTYQQIIDIYMVSEGENYPVSDNKADPASEPPYVIDQVIVVKPGQNYNNDDVVSDGVGQKYSIQVGTNGAILSVSQINKDITSLPEIKDTDDSVITIDSRTGYGAILRSRLKPKPEYQGEVKEVIDCVS